MTLVKIGFNDVWWLQCSRYMMVDIKNLMVVQVRIRSIFEINVGSVVEGRTFKLWVRARIGSH